MLLYATFIVSRKKRKCNVFFYESFVFHISFCRTVTQGLFLQQKTLPGIKPWEGLFVLNCEIVPKAPINAWRTGLLFLPFSDRTSFFPSFSGLWLRNRQTSEVL